MNPPNITDNIEIYKKFEDYAISGNIPSETDDHAILFAFVQTYETHWHSKSCKKYKNKSCCFSFGKFFTSETITAQSIKNVSKFKQFSVLEKWKMFQNILNTLINIYIEKSNCINQVILNMYLANYKSGKKITTGYFQYQLKQIKISSKYWSLTSLQ